MLPIALPALIVFAPGEDAEALLDLVRRHTEAQRVRDQATLRLTTAEAYVEVSPIGDVDPREKMLSFYGPDAKGPVATLTLLEPLTRVMGDTGIVIAKLAVSVTAPDGQHRDIAMRVTFVARRGAEGWKLVSSQYTSLPPQRPVAPKPN